MAGDWEKMTHDLADKPEVIEVADCLGVDPDLVVGKLHRLWTWASKNTSNGVVRFVKTSQIDRIARCDGLANLLKKVGWLREENDGIVFPKFNRHMSKSAKKRALDQRRRAASRADKSRKRSGQKADQRRGEERRDIDTPIGVSINPPPPLRKQKGFNAKSLTMPAELDSPEFASAWSDWVDHRTEISKPIKSKMGPAMLDMLAKLGRQRAIETIRHTIAMGWQGLREPEARKSASSSPTVDLSALRESDQR